MVRAKARNAAEWTRLVREWKKSGKTAAEFAAERGLRAHSLMWWRWYLKRREPAAAKAQDAGIRLVPVKLEADFDCATGEEQRQRVPAWELEAPSGHVLRVYGPADARVLREAIAALSRSR
ncbi:MAG TPA: hypothetical protein VKP30_30405 [Polyangiaceae bacterium]|nr:hypothetical protein [Polyangiaceae bacterium]